MLLSDDQAATFFRCHRALMWFVHEELKHRPRTRNPDHFSSLSGEIRLKAREGLLANFGLLDAFLTSNPCELGAEDLEVIDAWRCYEEGTFFFLRQLKNYAVLVESAEKPNAYAVVALTEPFAEVIGPWVPQMIETMLLPFADVIVYDSLILTQNVSLGSGIRRMLNDSYNEAKSEGRLFKTLPGMPSQPREKRTLTTKIVKKQAPTSKTKPNAAQPFGEIYGLVDNFCREHLSAEYADLCRKLTDKLARKRPSPLASGRPTTWACGIVRTIGLINYLDDRTQKPHMKLTAIDKIFGVGESTGQGKSMQIRKLLKIRQFDPEWTLPSQLDDNPLVWMIEVNGFALDVRHCTREVQVAAFERGLIPYIPADRRS